jgi:wyosine [tRNA(Phe)-imidazoG37] synthetase (radical SAM superfamily)
MLLSLKNGITYGPVNSRRLGASLGLNPWPGSVKVCTFNCVYCQYGWTRVRRAGDAGAPAAPNIQAVAAALEAALAALPSPPAFITFSGNGEPTLHPGFAELVGVVRAIRDRRAPGARTAVLSNSSRVTDPGILAALAGLDARIMKLDCGTEKVFRRFNGPQAGTTLEEITAGLAGLAESAPVTIQSLFCGGKGGNRSSGEVEAWVARLERIRPDFVQVYSLDRDTPARDLRKLEREELEAIAAAARSAGVRAETFGR